MHTCGARYLGGGGYIVSLFVAASQVLRLLRLIKLLRMLRLSRLFSRLQDEVAAIDHALPVIKQVIRHPLHHCT